MFKKIQTYIVLLLIVLCILYFLQYCALSSYVKDIKTEVIKLDNQQKKVISDTFKLKIIVRWLFQFLGLKT